MISDPVHDDKRFQEVERRAVLEGSVAALAVTMFGLVSGASVESDEQSPALSALRGEQSARQTANRIRRVVTGHNRQGRSCIISDEMVDLGTLWSTSVSEPLGANDPEESRGPFPTTRPTVDPPPGGTRWMLVTYQPTKDPKPTLVNRERFHRTATIDYVFVLSGEIVLLLDEQEVMLKAGELVVQRNTYHSWRNDGSVPALLLVTLVRIGA